MAITAVQSSAPVAGSTTSTVITVTSTTANSLIIVHVKLNDSTTTVTSVTDNVGNTYVLGSSYSGNTSRKAYQIYSLAAIGGVTTITVNVSVTTTYICYAEEFGGGPFLFDVRSTGTATAQTSISVSPFNPLNGELVVVTLINDGVAMTWTAGTGYTNFGGGNTLRSGYNLSSTTSETAPWTNTPGTSITAEIAAAFRIKSIKTINGLGIASVKTINGLGIASVKAVNSLSNI